VYILLLLLLLLLLLIDQVLRRSFSELTSLLSYIICNTPHVCTHLVSVL